MVKLAAAFPGHCPVALEEPLMQGSEELRGEVLEELQRQPSRCQEALLGVRCAPNQRSPSALAAQAPAGCEGSERMKTFAGGSGSRPGHTEASDPLSCTLKAAATISRGRRGHRPPGPLESPVQLSRGTGRGRSCSSTQRCKAEMQDAAHEKRSPGLP